MSGPGLLVVGLAVAASSMAALFLVSLRIRTGSMVTLALPESFGSTREDAVRLRDALLFEDEIEVQVHAARGRVRVRVCAQVYNDQADIERLGEAVAARK